MSNIGLTRDKHRELFLSLRFRRDEIEDILKEPEHEAEEARVQATNLKIIEGLMRHIGIDPSSKGATKQVWEILLESNVNVDEKTVRGRINKINEKPSATPVKSSARDAPPKTRKA